MEKEISNLIQILKSDYKRFISVGNKNDTIAIQVGESMIKEYDDSFSVTEGSKYIKLVANGAVHSFIVKKDFGKWKKGDILKPASFNAPATNFARGNIFKPESFAKFRWSGY